MILIQIQSHNFLNQTLFHNITSKELQDKIHIMLLGIVSTQTCVLYIMYSTVKEEWSFYYSKTLRKINFGIRWHINGRYDVKQAFNFIQVLKRLKM